MNHASDVKHEADLPSALFYVMGGGGGGGYDHSNVFIFFIIWHEFNLQQFAV